MSIIANTDRANDLIAGLAALNVKRIPRLCCGFMVQRGDSETQYAVMQDGRIFSFDTVRPNSNFGRHPKTSMPVHWEAVTELPDRAEFIGHYDEPSV